MILLLYLTLEESILIACVSATVFHDNIYYLHEVFPIVHAQMFADLGTRETLQIITIIRPT